MKITSSVCFCSYHFLQAGLMLQGAGSNEDCEIWPQAVPLSAALFFFFFVFAGDQITYAEVKVKQKSDNTNSTSKSTHTSMAIQQEI